MNRCTKAFLYKNNLKSNLENIRNLVSPEVKLCVAVKADSYGHNAVLTSKLCEEIGNIDFLAVATVDEGIELRNAGIKLNILLLSLCTPEEFNDLFKYEITPLVFTNEHISALAKAAEEYFKNTNEPETKHKVHLAVDTGMGRIGCYPEEAGEQAKLIADSKNLELGGMITHFCVSDSLQPQHQDFTKQQYAAFCKAVELVKAKGINPGICSCGASAAILNNKDFHFDMVRPGIITYGYYPDEITEQYIKTKHPEFQLKPVLSLETKVSAIRRFPSNKSVSYGRTFFTDKETDIAVLPIGYADGLLRRFSPGLTVTINGKNYPVVGRICMDQCMVDIGKDNPDVKVWDKVVIFGPEESGALNTADDLAKLGNTISYEVLTSLTKRVERNILE